jgi:hypothetical protein
VLAVRKGGAKNGAVPAFRLPCPLLLLLLAGAGCQFAGAVDLVPFTGPAPRTIVVWPDVAGPFAAASATLLTGLDAAVRQRGYRVVSSAVAAQLLADAGLARDPIDGDPSHGDQVRRVTGADAVLQVDVEAFATAADAPDERMQRADWDLTWRLVAPGSDAPLWQFAHHGHWDRRPPITVHPHPQLDDEMTPVLFGDHPPDFRDATDLLAWLHRFAMARLPQGDA